MRKVLVCISLLFPVLLNAQTGLLLPAVIVGGDTLPAYQLQDIMVVSKRLFKNAEDQSRFNALKRNVMIVYPFAKEAGSIFNEVNATLSEMGSRKERKKFMKEKEEQLNILFEGELKNLTITQGEILCKLVARETGLSVYDLIREFKNPFSAFYWNKMSQFLGYSLRYQYDPQEEKDIEFIVRSLEGDY